MKEEPTSLNSEDIEKLFQDLHNKTAEGVEYGDRQVDFIYYKLSWRYRLRVWLCSWLGHKWVDYEPIDILHQLCKLDKQCTRCFEKSQWGTEDSFITHVPENMMK